MYVAGERQGGGEARRGQEHWEDKEVSRVRVHAVVKETGNTVKITWAKKKRRKTLNNCQNKDPLGSTMWSTLDIISTMTASSPDAFLNFPWDLTSFSAKGSNSKRPGPNQRNTQYYC